MDNSDQKDQHGPTKVEDLERVVRVRKYRHCAAEYLKLAKEPNTMRRGGRSISEDCCVLFGTGGHRRYR